MILKRRQIAYKGDSDQVWNHYGDASPNYDAFAVNAQIPL